MLTVALALVSLPVALGTSAGPSLLWMQNCSLAQWVHKTTLTNLNVTCTSYAISKLHDDSTKTICKFPYYIQD